MKFVVEIIEEDGSDTSLADDDDFAVEQLRWMERDRLAGGYVTLDGTNYAMPVRIVGVVTAEDCPGDQKIMVVEPLDAEV